MDERAVVGIEPGSLDPCCDGVSPANHCLTEEMEITMTTNHSDDPQTVADRIESEGLPEGVHAHDDGTATVADRIESDGLPEGVHAHDDGTATVGDRIESDGLPE